MLNRQGGLGHSTLTLYSLPGAFQGGFFGGLFCRGKKLGQFAVCFPYGEPDGWRGGSWINRQISQARRAAAGSASRTGMSQPGDTHPGHHPAPGQPGVSQHTARGHRAASLQFPWQSMEEIQQKLFGKHREPSKRPDRARRERAHASGSWGLALPHTGVPPGTPAREHLPAHVAEEMGA